MPRRNCADWRRPLRLAAGTLGPGRMFLSVSPEVGRDEAQVAGVLAEAVAQDSRPRHPEQPDLPGNVVAL